MQAVPEPPPPPKFVGVYFLFDGDEIVYVGQSTDVPKRVAAHASRRDSKIRRRSKKWDRSTWIPLSIGDLDAYEGALIRRLTPRYNTSAPSDSSRDVEICAALDLPVRDLARHAEFLGRRRRAFEVPGQKRSEWNRRRKDFNALLRKHCIEHINDEGIRMRKLRSVNLWSAVKRQLAKAAS